MVDARDEDDAVSASLDMLWRAQEILAARHSIGTDTALVTMMDHSIGFGMTLSAVAEMVVATAGVDE